MKQKGVKTKIFILVLFLCYKMGFKLVFVTYSTSDSKFYRFGGKRISMKEKRVIEKQLKKDNAEYEIKPLKSGYRFNIYGSWDYLKPQYDELKQFIDKPETINYKDYVKIPILNKVLKSDNVIKRGADKCYCFGLSLFDGLELKRLSWIENDKGKRIKSET